MDLGLDDKVAVVAGGSRGCARGISAALAAEGARVLLSGRQGDTVQAAGALAAFLCSRQSTFLTGETIRIDGGYTKSLF